MKRDYIVKRGSDDKSVWAFQIYKSKLDKMEGDFNIVVICNYNESTQKIFKIPYSYLKQNILPKTKKDRRGRYLFEVNKKNSMFNWHQNVPMDGSQFLWKILGT